jgi:gliding motility-associated-like protein
MMIRFLLIAALFCSTFGYIMAQTDEDLVVYYSFDNNLLVDDLNNSAGVGLGIINEYECGVRGSALKVNGCEGCGAFIFGADVNNLFYIGDFTLSFYFKSYNTSGTIDLLSKRSACDADSALAIRYNVASGMLAAQLSESTAKNASIQQKVDQSRCWHMVTVVRDHTRTVLYLDGEYKAQTSILSVINLSNEAPLCISSGPCIGGSDKPLDGLIDEIRIYDRALEADEIQGLFFKPDQILNRDTIVYLGDQFDTRISPTCAIEFEWTPIAGVSNTVDPTTTIQPVQAGNITYSLSFDDGECVATDSLHVTVIDPATLDCKGVFVPSAFTPNGDNVNNYFGISNPKAVPELVLLEVYDRWGNRVFNTKDPDEKWDGSYRGQALNPGVYQYVLVWKCLGEELTKSGSVTIIR